MAAQCGSLLYGGIHGRVDAASTSTRVDRIASAKRGQRGRRRSRTIITAAAAGNSADRTVVIAGAGLAGLCTAVALHKVGIPVRVLERDDVLPVGGSAIAMWANAFRALDAIGVAAPLRAAHPLLERTELCSRSGQVLRSFNFERDCEGGPHEARGMRRSELLQAMAAALPPDTIHFGAPVEGVRTDASGAVEAEVATGRADGRGAVVVGADGVRSRVGAHLGLSMPNYAGYSAYRGLATFEEGLPLPLNTIRQVWGDGVRAGMYPISDTEMYWFTCFNAPNGSGPSSAEDQKQEALDSVRGWPFGVPEAIAATSLSDVSRGRLGDRWSLPGSTYGRGCVTVVGDAAHPMTPNLGQGGCTALEDGIILARLLQPVLGEGAPHTTSTERAAAVEGALREYERQRTRRCFKVTLRSAAFGQLLQLPFPPVCAVRNLFVQKAFSPAHFLDHATFNCGSLESAAVRS
mmetsp:Transcript_4027/g.11681  ORF Transcript_4027/g.11681 Transcript_4027/m.11681 type:complete len:463 (+) Transcript_4027:130-1518(+)|eukprot:CAMPEP_0206141034 /NCGR_PEP_ID=MMETSP1473-20131121/11578_1 /ASSEMBLY_ACC=CAM_ASM_001109 /TAXON_ID=1461547 /ORGANISM="Stichococcus sp, Strain RCC1054" /LENGTH=462 /DNA_ID=CAMNT_0053535431 /DNA_START=66 /DNA_END=1454 /DNA_ORIENTATION=+